MYITENTPNQDLDLDGTTSVPLANDSNPLRLPPPLVMGTTTSGTRQSRPIMARIPLNDTTSTTSPNPMHSSNSSHSISRTQSVSSTSSTSSTTTTTSTTSTRTIQTPQPPPPPPPKYTFSPSWVRQFWPQGLGLWINTETRNSDDDDDDVESGVGSRSSTSTLPPSFEELSRGGTPLPAYKSPAGLVNAPHRGEQEEDDDDEEYGIGWRRRVRWWAMVAVLCVGAGVCVIVWRLTVNEDGSNGMGRDTSQSQSERGDIGGGTPTTVSSSLSATNLRI